MAELIPAILALDPVDFTKKLRRVESFVECVQVDCLDGTFLPEVSWFDGIGIKLIETPVKYDLHLMVKDPVAVVDSWKEVPTLQRATFHLESVSDPEATIMALKSYGLEVCVAINPETTAEALRPYLDQIESVLLLGVHPGRSGQDLLPKTFEKITALRLFDPEIPISVDGGVTLENAPKLLAAGATRLIAANAVFKAKDLKETIRLFQSMKTTR